MTALTSADLRRVLLTAADEQDLPVTMRQIGELAVAVHARMPELLTLALGDCPLSDRQLQVLRLFANGVPDEEAAVRVGRSRNTVRRALAQALVLLGAESRTHAVALCMATGWITGADVEAPSAPLPPVAAPVAPEPRRSAAGASGTDAPGFVGHGSRPGRARDSRPDHNRPEEALSGPSRAPAAPGGPGPASSPGAPATAASQRIDPTTP